MVSPFFTVQLEHLVVFDELFHRNTFAWNEKSCKNKWRVNLSYVHSDPRLIIKTVWEYIEVVGRGVV